MADQLLIKFRDKDTGLGVKRETVKKIADKLGISETSAIHMAIARFHNDLSHCAEDFDFPSDEQLRKMDRHGDDLGKVISRQSIVDDL